MSTTPRPRAPILVVALGLGLTGCGAGEGVGSREPEGSGAAPESEPRAVRDLSALDAGEALDAALEARWVEAGVDVAPGVADDVFLRRASLDLIGRVPTVEERAAYLAAPTVRRRRVAVDRMLQSEAFVDYWARRHAQLLLGEEEAVKPIFMRGIERWAADALRDGQGWDDMVRDLLTAEGHLDEAPAGVFIVALERQGRDAAVAARVSESLLGVQLECAQCHDHPYDEFTREDFWGMAAYFARTRTRVDRSSTRRGARQFSIVERPRGETRIASELGGVRDTKVMPRFLGTPDAAAELAPSESHEVLATRRSLLAEHVLASDLAAKAAVGRVWTDLFGAGLHEPWNDLGGPHRGHDPILERLADDFEAHDWDLRWLLRTIVLSEAYGRSSSGLAAGRREAEAVFARARVRPLSAEQIFGSLMVVAGFERHGGRRFRRVTGQRPLSTLREVQSVFPAPGEQTGTDGEVTVAQALWLQNGGFTNAAPLEQARGELGVMVDQLADGEDVDAELCSLFHRIYGRDPGVDALRSLAATIETESTRAGRRAAWEDVAFALLTSTEFVTNH